MKLALALLALLAAAIGGFVLEHHLSVIHAEKAFTADSVERQHWIDSTTKLTAQLIADDSFERADSLIHVGLETKAANASHDASIAKLVVSLATMALDSAKIAADSLTVYRDELVPALHGEVTTLQSEVAVLDSAHTVATHGWQIADAQVTLYRAMHANDSVLIFADSIALHAKVSVLPISGPTFWKGLGDVGETAALGAATVFACKDGGLSVGCIAGAVATVAKVRPWRVLKH